MTVVTFDGRRVDERFVGFTRSILDGDTWFLHGAEVREGTIVYGDGEFQGASGVNQLLRLKETDVSYRFLVDE
jgi:hypothetical protein